MAIDRTSHITVNYDDGKTREEYFHNDLLNRQDGPAIVWRGADGSTLEEEYFCEGKQHRLDGPALIRHCADGSVVKEYYLDGKVVNKGDLTRLSGVTVQRPTPNTDTPDVPSPS